jgi:DNA-directed RNA polymerase subunit H (RpoH/RPB5)
MSKLVTVEYNKNQQVDIILLNIIKMLSERGLLDKSEIEAKHNKLIKKNKSLLEYKIKTNDNNFYIKFVNQKITSITKIVDLVTFLNENINNNKIIVVNNISKKAYKQIIEYTNTEIFWDFELMINLIDHHYIPKHVILPIKYQPNIFDKEQKYKDHEKIEDIYLVSKRECPKIEVTDPVARYYNMVPGQYVKIIRKSIHSGYVVSYRVVINSPISKLFDRL